MRGCGATSLNDALELICHCFLVFPAPSAADIEAAFKKFDKDGSGKIDRSELENLLKELGLPADQTADITKVRVVTLFGYIPFIHER